MISTEELKDIIENILQTQSEDFVSADVFLTEIKLSKDNHIKIFVDSPEGIAIEDCVTLNRKIRQVKNKDEEDYHLEVSSPGLDRPFKVKAQYLKNIGKKIQIKDTVGQITEGILTAVDETELILQRGQKEEKFNFEDIREARPVITF